MAALKFASSHNMVAFFDKPTKSDGFEQIVDFLNAHLIKYALTVNPTIYTSCIEQFWTIAKTTAWNKFSSTMASVVICLATNKKFNLSKYIFDNMVKNLEGGVKFLMYPRFVQVFLDKQVEGMSKHKEIYVTPSHTKKVFANIKRQGKDFSGRDTPLFPTMIVQAQEQVGEEPVTDDTGNVASVPTHSNDPLLCGEDRVKLNELMELCTCLSQRVLDLEKTKTSQAAEIRLKERVLRKKKRKEVINIGLKDYTRLVDLQEWFPLKMKGRYGDNLMFNTGVLDNEQDMVEKEKLAENVEAGDEVDDDQEEAEMKKHMEIDDEVAIDTIPLATKPSIIVDWKIIKEGKMGYFQIIRADGSSKSSMEPRNIKDAMTDPAWIDSMQEELLQFKRLDIFLVIRALKIIHCISNLDVKTAFLHGTLKEDVYVCLPEGFIDADNPSHVYKLKKELCGLKQVLRAWYYDLSKFLQHNHFNKGTIDPTLFIRRFDDDILVVQAKPTEKHLKEVKMIFCYLWGTINMGLWYTKDSGFELTGFSDVDFAGCKDTFKSTSSGTQFLGKKLVSWSSKKQDCTTLSTAKAEYVSLSACCAQVIWMRTQLTDYGFDFNNIPIYCD
ncbi:retrovirus-related pol polyprotein from transposon TNT 1-94 [Tanacetum coccineum]